MKKKKELKISRRTVMKGALAAGAMMSADLYLQNYLLENIIFLIH